MSIHYKIIFYCFLFCIPFGCSQEKTTQLKADTVKKQTTSIYQMVSDQFVINGLTCHWKYNYITNFPNRVDSTAILLLDKQLIHLKTDQKILICQLSDLDEYPLRDLKNLKTRDIQPLKFDINFDGYTDYQYIETHTSGNKQCWVYLYNPKFQNFTYSKELSGNAFHNTGIQLNDSKKMATYTSKGGGGLYSVRQVFFDSLGQIKFQQLFWNEATVIPTNEKDNDSINLILHSKKIQADGKTTTKKERITIEDKGLEYLYKTFFNWVNTK